jgi:hypothetical protein
LAGGMILFTLAVLLSSFVPASSVFRTIIQGIGLLLALASMVVACTAVYRINTMSSENESILETVRSISTKSHLILAVVFFLSAAIVGIVLLETAVSFLGMIPYAGAVLASLMSGLFYILNIVLIAGFSVVLAVMPPLSLRVRSFMELRKHIVPIIKKNWLQVLLYLLVSISCFILAVTIIYYIARYALGITVAVQWKINAAYPRAVSTIALGSFAVDIIRKITPSPDPIGAFMEYGSSIFDYVDMIKVVLTISYAFAASAVVSFPLAIYFRVSALFYKRIDDSLQTSE